MASAAAATSASRRHQLKLQRSWQREKEAEAKAALRSRAAQVLDQLSPDGQYLEINDLPIFLRQTFQVRKPDQDALQRVENLDVDDDGRLDRHALVVVAEKYQEYMNKKEMIEDIFQRYNKARDGQLTKREVYRMLQDQERRNNDRYAKGMAITLIVSPDELNCIMIKADASGNGKIDRSELLTAMEVWERLAQEKLHLKQTTACGGCVIL